MPVSAGNLLAPTWKPSRALALFALRGRRVQFHSQGLLEVEAVGEEKVGGGESQLGSRPRVGVKQRGLGSEDSAPNFLL